VFPAERRHRILELVRQNGAVSLRELATAVRTSEVTVRRDVRALQADGLIDRRHGGAMVPGRVPGPLRGGRPHGIPEQIQLAGPDGSIAATAAELVDPGDAIVLGAGRLSADLATLLAGVHGLVVVTNSLPAAGALAEAPGIEVVLTGGVLHGAERALVGETIGHAVAGLRVRRAFLCGGGLTAARGLSARTMLLAAADRALAGTAAEVVALVEADRVGLDGMFPTVPPERVSHLVTGAAADPDALARLVDRGVGVRLGSLGTRLLGAAPA
jgi:DeoR/GlpR family transcriptional regulator of sugar metabolism